MTPKAAKKLKRRPRTVVRDEFQPFLDEFVHDGKPVRMAANVAAAFGRPPLPIDDLFHYERVKLRWMEPDGAGGLRPKNKSIKQGI